MAIETTDEYTVLHALKVKGIAPADAVATSLGTDAANVEPLLDAAVADGLVKRREGRMAGYTLTAAGRERHGALRAATLDDAAEAKLADAYAAFLAPNRAFKELTTAWQLRPEDSDPAPLLEQLEDLDREVLRLLQTASEGQPRFAIYGRRFTAALGRLRAGDETAFARPLSDSYHDVWMELHEDLIATLGLERTEADE
jgi:DNA-binding MarR family transcriptional regulator